MTSEIPGLAWCAAILGVVLYYWNDMALHVCGRDTVFVLKSKLRNFAHQKISAMHHR
jgi:hypothetical protein